MTEEEKEQVAAAVADISADADSHLADMTQTQRLHFYSLMSGVWGQDTSDSCMFSKGKY